MQTKALGSASFLRVQRGLGPRSLTTRVEAAGRCAHSGAVSAHGGNGGCFSTERREEGLGAPPFLGAGRGRNVTV